MTLAKKFRSYYKFFITERAGRRRPVTIPFVVTPEDLAKHDEADNELRRIRKALRYLDAEADVFRRPKT